MLVWQLYRNIENSLKDFLDTSIASDSVTDYDGNAVTVRIGRKEDNAWTLPTIAVYYDAEDSERLEIGSNKRIKLHLLIIDIYAINEGQRIDLAAWLSAKIENGFRYYTYTVDPGNPETPTKVAGGLVNIEDFISNTRIELAQNVDAFDAHRHRVSIQTWISGNY